MKYILITLLLISSITYSQKKDTIRIVHTNYTTLFDKTLKYPVLVEWWETKAKVNCANPLVRKNNYRPDPVIKKETNLSKDYTNSGFDRGHLCPSASNECISIKVLDECFYYSNIAPQTHNLNAGTWKVLEELTREKSIEKDSIHVWAGVFGSMGKIGRVTIPTNFWKVIHIKKTNEWYAYVFSNSKVKDILGLPPHIVKVSYIEKLTGFTFQNK